jgi:hypothetical protein
VFFVRKGRKERKGKQNPGSFFASFASFASFADKALFVSGQYLMCCAPRRLTHIQSAIFASLGALDVGAAAPILIQLEPIDQ